MEVISISITDLDWEIIALIMNKLYIGEYDPFFLTCKHFYSMMGKVVEFNYKGYLNFDSIAKKLQTNILTLISYSTTLYYCEPFERNIDGIELAGLYYGKLHYSIMFNLEGMKFLLITKDRNDMYVYGSGMVGIYRVKFRGKKIKIKNTITGFILDKHNLSNNKGSRLNQFLTKIFNVVGKIVNTIYCNK
jgi:hypothetical protein